MLIKSSSHPVGGTIQWRVQYANWLANAAYIMPTSTVVSDEATYVISGVQVLGKDIVFLVAGGTLNVTTTITVTMIDSFGNVLPDTINLVGVAP